MSYGDLRHLGLPSGVFEEFDELDEIKCEKTLTLCTVYETWSLLANGWMFGGGVGGSGWVGPYKLLEGACMESEHLLHIFAFP